MTTDKGKPAARRGRKATDLQEVAELPKSKTVATPNALLVIPFGACPVAPSVALPYLGSVASRLRSGFSTPRQGT